VGRRAALEPNAKGQIHLNEKNQICLGQSGKGGYPITFPRDGTLGVEYVRSLLNGALRKTVVNSLRVESIRHAVDKSSEEERSDWEVSTACTVGVKAVRADTKGRGRGHEQGLTKDDQNRVVKKAKDRESRLPTSRQQGVASTT
jgi:hypothetical protein